MNNSSINGKISNDTFNRFLAFSSTDYTKRAEDRSQSPLMKSYYIWPKISSPKLIDEPIRPVRELKTPVSKSNFLSP
jgi:hypothetical protein